MVNGCSLQSVLACVSYVLSLWAAHEWGVGWGAEVVCASLEWLGGMLKELLVDLIESN